MVLMKNATRPIIAATLTTLALPSLASTVAPAMRSGPPRAEPRAGRPRPDRPAERPPVRPGPHPVPALGHCPAKTLNCTSGTPAQLPPAALAAVKLAYSESHPRTRQRLGTSFFQPGRTRRLGQDFSPSLVSHPNPRPCRVLLARFEKKNIVGVARAGSGSTPIRCFATKAEADAGRVPVLRHPRRSTERIQQAWIDAARLGRGCSTTGRSIASAIPPHRRRLDLDVCAARSRPQAYLPGVS